jgi:hypothetical protein
MSYLHICFDGSIFFEVWHPRCVSQIHKIKQQVLDSQKHKYIIILYI